MPAIKLQNFLAKAPRRSSELLKDGQSQISENQRTFSGDLLPYRLPTLIGDTLRPADLKTIYNLRDPSGQGNDIWLSFTTDVDIVIASSTEDAEQRFYYTGDGIPKVSNYELASTGPGPFPNLFYELGLDFPETEVTTTVAAFNTLSTTSRERDAGNNATLVTSTPHGLRTGNTITISGFDPGDNDDEAAAFNATNVTVTVIDDTTIQYFNRGDPVSTTADTDGKVDLAGSTQVRSYVFTWYTPWLEESIASDPSDDIFLKEGQTVTVSSIPTAPPAGDNFIRGVRLYRLVNSQNRSEYFLLKTLWYPINLSTVERTANVSTIVTQDYHNLIEGDRFKIDGATNTSFNITDGEVKEVIDQYTFTFDQVDSDVAETSEGSGVLFHDVAESLADPARYFGDGGDYDFTDDFLVSNLSVSLETDDYDKPNPDMVGLVIGQNNILAGFFDNQFCLSEPGRPHAWPIKYRLTFESNIVGIASFGGFFLVLTEDFPFQVSGSDPAVLDVARIEAPYPCLSKRSITNMPFGVVYATHGGLANYSSSGGIQLITQFVHYWETWEKFLDPSTIVGVFYDGKYFASYTKDGTDGAFMFEPDRESGGFLVDITVPYGAAFLDPDTNVLAITLTEDDDGKIYQFDSEDEDFLPVRWKSKTIVTKNFLNLGAARVVGDYDVDLTELENAQEFNDNLAALNAQLFAAVEQFGTLNGGTPYVDPDFGQTPNRGTLNAMILNGNGVGNENRDGGGIIQSQVLLLPANLPAVQPVIFRLFINKEQIFETQLSDSSTFRLPTGYRTDTFEVEVSGSARIRAIHLAETPFGLREA